MKKQYKLIENVPFVTASRDEANMYFTEVKDLWPIQAYDDELGTIQGPPQKTREDAEKLCQHILYLLNKFTEQNFQLYREGELIKSFRTLFCAIKTAYSPPYSGKKMTLFHKGEQIQLPVAKNTL